MKNLIEITSDLKSDIEVNQDQLKNAIRNHQDCFNKLQDDRNNIEVLKQISRAEQNIILIGLAQKRLLDRLRDEYRQSQNTIKETLVKTNLDERRYNLSTALNRARKQNIVSTAAPLLVITGSGSDDNDSGDGGNGTAVAATSSAAASLLFQQPEPKTFFAIQPQDLPKSDFFTILGLATHDVYKEMFNKRAERKRRSTANPQFIYTAKGWDFPHSSKRKRSNPYLSSVSPPHTRQSVKKKNIEQQQIVVSPPKTTANNNNNNKLGLIQFVPFPQIPNLPSGLTIERVSPSSLSSPDSKACITCRQSTGLLSVCENCTNGFHVGCHNRPLTQTPRQCPRCIIKEVRTVGSLNVPSGMSVSYITPSEVSEKLEEKDKLKKENQTLTAELTQLQDRHSQLTISLKNQKTQQDDLLMTQHSTEEKIKQLLSFINDFQLNK